MTTHSMEEVEELADRIAFLADGQIKCLGTPQYVLNSLGRCHKVYISFTRDPQRVEQRKESVRSMVQDSLGVVGENDAKNFQLEYEVPITMKSELVVLLKKLDVIPYVRVAMDMSTLEDAYLEFYQTRLQSQFPSDSVNLKESMLSQGGTLDDIVRRDSIVEANEREKSGRGVLNQLIRSATNVNTEDMSAEWTSSSIWSAFLSRFVPNNQWRVLMTLKASELRSGKSFTSKFISPIYAFLTSSISAIVLRNSTFICHIW
eukprot:CAMPEP_0114979812 /NCGR_PEP_ID=MMETSP0216-20121206/4593_1 /TAXON_ID=223996 /ORGANISM="Protocruzia adherens, Strain Boccale" /LENGTH=259 /DNA_ID=CAMNT_0002341207 /DNA_START=987 /DNA_END=1763 /DNA_ORIENTATION=+